MSTRISSSLLIGAILGVIAFGYVTDMRFRLFTTSVAFFLYDFINFPNDIMSSTVISSLAKDGNIQTTAIWQVILAILPGPGVVIGAWLSNAGIPVPLGLPDM